MLKPAQMPQEQQNYKDQYKVCYQKRHNSPGESHRRKVRYMGGP